VTQVEGGPKVAILGAGHVGTVIARLAARAGLPVSVAASGDPDEIALTLSVLAPGTAARWAAEAASDADGVILAIPLHRLSQIEPAALAGKVVIDMMNYWPEVNGHLAEYDRSDITSSELVVRRLAGSRVVKTFNHLGYHQLDEEARPAGDPQRKALGVAGDDPQAVALVTQLVEKIGFDAVPIGGLSAGRLLQPDGPVFGKPLGREEFESALLQVAV